MTIHYTETGTPKWCLGSTVPYEDDEDLKEATTPRNSADECLGVWLRLDLWAIAHGTQN